jgi:hypothetical protein
MVLILKFNNYADMIAGKSQEKVDRSCQILPGFARS